MRKIKIHAHNVNEIKRETLNARKMYDYARLNVMRAAAAHDPETRATLLRNAAQEQIWAAEYAAKAIEMRCALIG